MKKLIIILAAVAAAILIGFGVTNAIQNRNRNKSIENINSSMEQVDQHVQGDSTQIQQEQQQAPASTAQRPDSEGYCGTISWHDDASAWEETPISKDEFRELAQESSFGEPVRLPGEQRIEEIIGALTVDHLYSDKSTQSVVWFTYKGNDGKEHRSKLLIQGPVNCDEKEDLKGLINAQTKCCSQQITDCSILFGGRLCTTPPCQKVVKQPCDKGKTQPCLPCQQGQGPKRTLDGATTPPASNGKSKTLPTVDGL